MQSEVIQLPRYYYPIITVSGAIAVIRKNYGAFLRIYPERIEVIKSKEIIKRIIKALTITQLTIDLWSE